MGNKWHSSARLNSELCAKIRPGTCKNNPKRWVIMSFTFFIAHSVPFGVVYDEKSTEFNAGEIC